VKITLLRIIVSNLEYDVDSRLVDYRKEFTRQPSNIMGVSWPFISESILPNVRLGKVEGNVSI
jgi:hypothetical protein